MSIYTIDLLINNSPETVNQCKQLHSSVGNISNLEKGIEALKGLPGALRKDGPITKLLECGIKTDVGSLATARGAAYEIEKAY